MPEMKYATTGPEFQRDAKEYVVNMLGGKRKLHKKNGCQHASFFAEYYDFDSKEDADESGIEFTICGHCLGYQIAKHKTPTELVETHINLSGAVRKKYTGRSWDRIVYYDNKKKNVVFSCKNCGAELYGEFEFADSYTARKLRDHADSNLRNERNKYSPDEGEILDLEKTYQQVDEIVQLVDKDEEEANREYKRALESACPICGAKLSNEKGFFLPDNDWFREDHHFVNYSEGTKELERRFGDDYFWNDSYEKKLKKLVPIREKQDRGQACRDALSYAEKCDLPAFNSSVNAGGIKTNSEELKKYILHLIQLENNIYSLREQLSDLYYRRLGNDRAVVFGTCEPAYEIRLELDELRAAYQNELNAAKDAEVYQPEVSVVYPDEPAAPVLGKPGLFNKKKVEEENAALTAKYQAAMDAYHEEVKRCDEEKVRLIAEARAAVIGEAQAKADVAKAALEQAEDGLDSTIKELEARPIPAKAIKDVLDREIAEAEELMKKTFAARNELYACEIIFGKYRDVVALSSFYEYLMSGRCTSLEGADGAYNIYESEIRANRVIAQLDTVISALEDIKQNQYMMYQELRNINASLSRLNSTMDKALTSIQSIETNTVKMNEYLEHISENSDVIAHNTAVTAYYSKVNAELTNALGYMVAFK